ncbi:MAG: hypothetical protein KGL64_04500, partial [Acidobacteriota bacterium]|nr:hypothetical protein [Acidobacteriota bacterium]
MTAMTASAQVVIDHRWSNTDAQSMIGLPMGSHKTIVDKHGNLKWSQWSLKRKPLDTPIGFSSQMDGELAIEAFAGTEAFAMKSQELYRGRYPFIESKLATGSLELDDLAFAVDPDAKSGEIPTASSGAKGLDVVRLKLTNDGSETAEVELKLSGRERNLPGHVVNRVLENGAGEDVALVTETDGASVRSEDHGLTLALRVTLSAHATKTLSVEVPYEWPAARNAELSQADSALLLQQAVAQWDGL